MSLKIAFSGAGYIANIHARALQSLPGVKLVAVADQSHEMMDSFTKSFNIPCQYSTVEELLAQEEVDALVIGTPNYLHAPQAIAALQAGVHMLLEKPMAMNAAEAETILEASQKSDAILMVGHCWRFDEEVRWLRAQVEADRLGKIIRTKGYGAHLNWGPAGWFTQARFAGYGAIADMGIHAVDTARYLLGNPQPVSVYAHIGTYYLNDEVDDTGVIIVNWENGVISYIESGWWQPHVDGPEAATQLYGMKGFGSVFPTRLELPDPAGQRIEVVDAGFVYPREVHCVQSMYDRQMAYFVDCICNHRTPVPGGLEGWINMKIVDAAFESSRTGKVVKVR